MTLLMADSMDQISKDSEIHTLKPIQQNEESEEGEDHSPRVMIHFKNTSRTANYGDLVTGQQTNKVKQSNDFNNSQSILNFLT